MSAGNGRYGGGSGGSEDRYHYPAVDTAQWSEARVGRYDTSPQQGESGQVIGSYVNTMDAPRGKIMGATINCCWPENGFLK